MSEMGKKNHEDERRHYVDQESSVANNNYFDSALRQTKKFQHHIVRM